MAIISIFNKSHNISPKPVSYLADGGFEFILIQGKLLIKKKILNFSSVR